MEDQPILTVLSDKSHIETQHSSQLREEAVSLVSSILNQKQDLTSVAASTSPTEIANVLEPLNNLLTEVIKPLFQQSQHPNLTSSGRRNQFSNSSSANGSRREESALLPSAVRFDSSILTEIPIWKNGWTVTLLRYILNAYLDLPLEQQDKCKLIETKIPLLTPPILHLLDDIEINYKASGCRCLRLLCDVLTNVHSDALRRTGLMDVFVDAVKESFLLLPTLTPEDESLIVLREVYEAWKSLIRARFILLQDFATASEHNTNIAEDSNVKDEQIVTISKSGSTTTTITRNKLPEKNGSLTKMTSETIEKEKGLRQKYLTMLLRHQLLHSLSHLSTGTGAGGTISLSLSTFLLSQIPWIVSEMGISSARHLEAVIPLLRHTLVDPFGTAAPQLLQAALDGLQKVIEVCWPRIRERWWSDCLRAVVGCWFNVADDLEHIRDEDRKRKLEHIRDQLRTVVMLLEDIVGDEFGEAKQRLILEEPDLKDLLK